MRLDYGLAEARVHGWIPLRADLDVWTTTAPRTASSGCRLARAELLHVAGVPARRPRAIDRVDVEPDAAPARDLRTAAAAHDAPHHVRLAIDLGWRGREAARLPRHRVRAALLDLVSCTRTGGDAARRHRSAGRDGRAVAVAARAAAARRPHPPPRSRPAVPTQEVPCAAHRLTAIIGACDRRRVA